MNKSWILLVASVCLVAIGVQAHAQGACITTEIRGCFIDNRFSAEVSWRDSDSNLYSPARVDASGDGFVLPVNDEINTFVLDQSERVDVIVRVLDGTTINDNYWVFAGATTAVEFTLIVTDTQTGAIKQYINPLGNPAGVITDTGAFPNSGGVAPKARAQFASATVQSLRVVDPKAKGVACESSATRVCLRENRFAVDVDYLDFQGGNGSANGAPIGGDQTAAFGVFEDDRVGVLVSVIDGTAINGQFWYAATMITNLQTAVTVTDTQTGETSTLLNPLGATSPALYDLGTLGNTINRGHSGFWFNAETSGQGFSVEFSPALDNFGFLAFYGYEPPTVGSKLGSNDHRWFTAQGNYSGDTLNLDVFNTTGGAFNDPQATSTTQVGTAQFVVQDCYNAVLAITLPDDQVDTQIPLTRLLPQAPGLGELCEVLSLGGVPSGPN